MFNQSNVRPSFEKVKQLARGNWRLILTSLGLPPECLNNHHGPCPVCGGTDRFRFDDKGGSGSHYCNGCGAGDGFNLVAKWLRVPIAEARDAVASALSLTGADRTFITPGAQPTPLIAEPPSNAEAMAKAALSRWREARPIEHGDVADTYLRKRKLWLTRFPDSLRLHPSLLYLEGGKVVGTFPAILARIDKPDGNFATVHRIYLSDEGWKAPVPTPKKLYPSAGAIRGSAVQLCKPAQILAIAEGIETALAYHLLTQHPVWAAVTATGMETVILPGSVREVHVCVDLDRSGAGARSANKLIQRLLTEGRRVYRATPPGCIPDGAKSFDWLNVLEDSNYEHPRK